MVSETFKNSLIINKVDLRKRNIIIGSIIGDGSLALYGRSRNAHYREHGCNAQIDYRTWKWHNLRSLGFNFSSKGKLSSPSNEMFTELHSLFYNNKIKTLTKDNLQLLDHPIGLACLYLDDGSLVMDFYTKPKKLQIFPRVSLYTQSFTYEENLLLQQHIYNRFNVPFKIRSRPDGNKYSLELNERNELYNFIKLIEPYVNEISCMNYKINLNKRMEEAKLKLSNQSKYKDKKILTSPLIVVPNKYSDEEINMIIELKQKGYSHDAIATLLKRPYYGIVDKISRLNKEGIL